MYAIEKIFLRKRGLSKTNRKDITLFILLLINRNSSVGIANRYGLDGPGIESPIPVTERSKARVCGLLLAGASSSNPGGGMDVRCTVRTKDKSQDNQEEEAKTEDKKIPSGARFLASVQTDSESHT